MWQFFVKCEYTDYYCLLRATHRVTTATLIGDGNVKKTYDNSKVLMTIIFNFHKHERW